jgi:hypothetical protein
LKKKIKNKKQEIRFFSKSFSLLSSKQFLKILQNVGMIPPQRFFLKQQMKNIFLFFFFLINWKKNIDWKKNEIQKTRDSFFQKQRLEGHLDASFFKDKNKY